MSEGERTTLCNTVIDICDESFPKKLNNDTRLQCHVYFGQVLMPLLIIKCVQSLKLADIMAWVGDFLEVDGKYNDSAKVLREVVEIRAAGRGVDHPSTLRSIVNNSYLKPGFHVLKPN